MSELAIGQCGKCGAVMTADHVCGEALIAKMKKLFDAVQQKIIPEPEGGGRYLYKDIDGNECTLEQLCSREPAWAANRLRLLAKQRSECIEENRQLRDRVKELEELRDDDLTTAPPIKRKVIGRGTMTIVIDKAEKGKKT